MKILRETCLEYFRRRLSEGWKCISLIGNYATLLSPDGVRRKLDLRNDVETLRPNAAGDQTDMIPTGNGANYECVNEAVADEWTTYVQTGLAGTPGDLYNLPSHSEGSGTINKITVYVREYALARDFQIWIKIGGTIYKSSAIRGKNNFVTYNNEWAQNPDNAHAWTWDEIDALQAGMGLVAGSGSLYFTQVYVEVDYTYTPPPPPAEPEYQKREIAKRSIYKAIRDIAPGAVGTFWLPETGHIDLSKYLASSWGIYAPTTATMVINCYLNISHDGGTTWRRAAGYEILDADFVRDVWDTIDCPLMLAEAKLEVVITIAHPAELDLMCIAKP